MCHSRVWGSRATGRSWCVSVRPRRLGNFPRKSETLSDPSRPLSSSMAWRGKSWWSRTSTADHRERDGSRSGAYFWRQTPCLKIRHTGCDQFAGLRTATFAGQIARKQRCLTSFRQALSCTEPHRESLRSLSPHRSLGPSPPPGHH